MIGFGRVSTGVVIAIAAPLSPAFAEVCDKVRPRWTGDPLSMIGEWTHFIYSPAGLLIAFILAVTLLTRLRVIALVGAVISAALAGMTFYRFSAPSEIRQAALAEGCVGTPWLVIVTLILCGMLMMTFARAQAKHG